MQNKMIQKVKTDEIFFDELTDLDADVISDYIIKKYEKPLLLKILKERYEYLTPWQKRYVLDNKDKSAFSQEKDL